MTPASPFPGFSHRPQGQGWVKPPLRPGSRHSFGIGVSSCFNSTQSDCSILRPAMRVCAARHRPSLSCTSTSGCLCGLFRLPERSFPSACPNHTVTRFDGDDCLLRLRKCDRTTGQYLPIGPSPLSAIGLEVEGNRCEESPDGGFLRSTTGSALYRSSPRPPVVVLRFTAAKPLALDNVRVPRNG